MPAAVITGAASGIGRAVAQRLAGDGWSLALLDVQAAEVERVAEPLGALAVPCDVSDPAAVRAAVDEVGDRFAELDGLVGVAGIERPAGLGAMDFDVWQRTLGVNLTGQFLCLQACLPLLERARGAAVCVGSPLGRATYPEATAYAASKAGVEGLVRAAAVECASAGVRVNCVLPGPCDTAMMRAAVTETTTLEAVLEDAAAAVPLGRVAQAEEMTGAIAFLLSADAAYVTGASLAVDGGLLAKLAIGV